MNKIAFSIIIPVYNRPKEIQELLTSLTLQTNSYFEVIVIEDGSTLVCKSIIKDFEKKLKIEYIYQENTGPAYARNHGMKLAKGNYFIFFDSDCIIPPTYIQEVFEELHNHYVDAFGGADKAHNSFTNLQKAINYSMTSIFTTGGIRGKKYSLGRFQPRSFNMGISQKVFQQTGGFGRIFPGEDPDFTLRIWKKGFQTRFFPNAFVYHKRRLSFSKFSKQVYRFGKVRPMLNYFHKDYTKLAFWFPSFFIIGILFTILTFILSFFLFPLLLKIPFILISLYLVLIIIDSSLKNKSLTIGFLSILTTLIQFFSYGWGFLQAQIQINLLGKHPEVAFPENFCD
ncbi:MAG: glycosyltransferase [Flavobacteriales bacterium]